MAKALVTAGAAIMFVLGMVHLAYTYFGAKLAPADPAVQDAMRATPLGLTAETTVWNAWVGFNASHSLCAIFFGLVYAYLALGQGELLARSGYLQAVGLGVLVAFVVLARLYWFSVPFFGVSAALACYLVGVVLLRA